MRKLNYVSKKIKRKSNFHLLFFMANLFHFAQNIHSHAYKIAFKMFSFIIILFSCYSNFLIHFSVLDRRNDRIIHFSELYALLSLLLATFIHSHVHQNFILSLRQRLICRYFHVMYSNKVFRKKNANVHDFDGEEGQKHGIEIKTQ